MLFSFLTSGNSYCEISKKCFVQEHNKLQLWFHSCMLLTIANGKGIQIMVLSQCEVYDNNLNGVINLSNFCEFVVLYNLIELGVVNKTIAKPTSSTGYNVGSCEIFGSKNTDG